jgi:CSLREA domain-containing protein
MSRKDLLGLTTAAVVVALALLLAPAAASGATINVDATADGFSNNGSCSLREAVQSANVDGVAQVEPGCETGSGADLIDIDNGPSYLLTLGPPGVNDISQGDLEVTDPDGLEVEGEGTLSSVIDGAGLDRVFEVAAGTLTLDSLRLTGGIAAGGGSGGGILASSPVTLLNASVSTNTTTGGNGGGILISGTGSALTVNNSAIVGNDATVGSGGGVEIAGGASLVTNGADAEISSNDAGSQGGGINLSTGAGDITLDPGAKVENNSAVALGGGIAVNSGTSDLLLNGATIDQNSVSELLSGLASGGGIYYAGAGRLSLTDSFVDFNTVTGDEAQGGGIDTSNSADSFTLTRSVVVNNTVTVENDADSGTFEGGGGIAMSGLAVASFTDSLIAANHAIVNDPQDSARGGGMRDSGALVLNRTSFWMNDVSGGTPLDRGGGGLFVEQPTGTTQVLNSTFSGNTVGVVGAAQGAGIQANVATQPVIIAHTTFAENVAASGAAFNPFGAMGNFTLRSSVIDQGATGCIPNSLPGVNGFNVDAGTSCVGPADDTDLETTDPTLGPLVDNGGPLLGGEASESTRTHELSGPASVFDLVPIASCEDHSGFDLLVDQRGAPRPTDAGCEPGSYEIVRCLGQPAFVGSPGNDTIFASFFVANAFHGLAGNDAITGDGDANRLCGDAGNDVLNGFTGNDQIDGGSGNDQLLGDADMDSLFARDGEADTVDCGTEADTAQTDRLSLDSVTGCEAVDALPEPPAASPNPAPVATVPATKKKCKKKKKRSASAAKKCKKKRKK